jgi:hypothetical protein
VSTPLRIRDLAIAWPVLSVSALLIRNFPFYAEALAICPSDFTGQLRCGTCRRRGCPQAVRPG